VKLVHWAPSLIALLTLAVALFPCRAEAADAAAARDDSDDPLPKGALLRLGSLRFRHPSNVHELALSPDEKTVVTIGEELIAWDAATGKERWRADLRTYGIDVLQRLLEQFSLQLAALTRGANGALLMSQSGEESDLPGHSVEIADTVGAG
jgi:hypothetical protein